MEHRLRLGTLDEIQRKALPTFILPRAAAL
jgi:hypothetical protein